MRVDPNYISNLAGALNQSSSVEDTLTSELSSGLSVVTLQDNPVAVAESTLLASSIAQDDTFVQTASGESSLMQVADSTLGDVVTQITSALSLAVEGNNGTLNASNTTIIAQQLSGIRDQVLSLANTSYQGQYLFGGSQGSVQPFTLDTSTNPATTNYVGDTQVQFVETPNGQKLQVNLPGSAVFGSGSSRRSLRRPQPTYCGFYWGRLHRKHHNRHCCVDNLSRAVVHSTWHAGQFAESIAVDQHLHPNRRESASSGTEQFGVCESSVRGHPIILC